MTLLYIDILLLYLFLKVCLIIQFFRVESPISAMKHGHSTVSKEGGVQVQGAHCDLRTENLLFSIFKIDLISPPHKVHVAQTSSQRGQCYTKPTVYCILK